MAALFCLTVADHPSAMAAEPTAPTASQPNVVLILADDLGWSDTTLFETTKFYQTPNIQRLASRGITFTHAYASSPLCSPTRASILTGLSPAKTQITAPVCHLPQVTFEASIGATAAPNQKAVMPSSATRLSTDYYTLAEMLQDNGYATGHFGKWHLGNSPHSALEHGFDVDVPHWHGPGPAGSYVAPWHYDPDFDPRTPTEHIEDRMADEAVAFMQKNRDRPFFMNYWMFSVHAPFDAKPELIEAYRKKVDPKDPQRSPTYAAMIESMDDAVGTLLDELDRLNIADNTIIIFASDNGGNMYNEVDGTSATSNAPLKGGKATMYEGGVRGPAIVTYPKVVQAGTRSDEVIQSIDFYPTLIDLLKVEPRQELEFDGVSIVPALRGGQLKRDAIFTYFPHSPRIPDWLPPAVSVHQNDWKLIRIFHGGDAGKHRYKLFNLSEDLGETDDLSAKMPGKVREMDQLIEGFLDEADAVRPIRNPKFDPSKYDSAAEGKAKLKGGSNKPAKPGKPRIAGKPVAGWYPGFNCKLAIVDGSLTMTSLSRDPQLSFRLPQATEQKDLRLTFKMRSDSTGDGQVFWHQKDVAPRFAAARQVEFKVQHDNKVHEYSIDFQSQGPVAGIRIDPSRGHGELAISDLQLSTQDGTIIQTWSFEN